MPLVPLSSICNILRSVKSLASGAFVFIIISNRSDGKAEVGIHLVQRYFLVFIFLLSVTLFLRSSRKRNLKNYTFSRLAGHGLFKGLLNKRHLKKKTNNIDWKKASKVLLNNFLIKKHI